MKKLVIFLIIVMTVLLTGCPGGEEEKTGDSSSGDEKLKKIDEKVSKEFMDNYMRYMLSGNVNALNSFYSSDIKEKVKNTPLIVNPRPIGYKLGEGESKKGKMEVTAHIYSEATDRPYYSDDTYIYDIEELEGKMLITKIKKDKSIELFLMEKALYKREGEKVKGERVLKLDELPLFTTVKGSSETKYSVPRDAFGPCAIAPDSKSYLVTSLGDNNSFIAVIMSDKAQEVISQKEQSSGEGKSDENKQDEGSNVSIEAIDLFLSSRINLISFAPDSKTIVVDVIPKEGQERIHLYKGEKWDPIKTYIDKHFEKSRFSIKNPYFVDKNKLIFTVVPIKNATTEEQSQKGEWSYDIKNDKVTQIK